MNNNEEKLFLDFTVRLAKAIKKSKSASKSLHCPVCKKVRTSTEDLIAINNLNMCLSCDHIQGEVTEQQLAEAKEAEKNE